MNTFSCPIVITGASAITVAGTGIEPVIAALAENRCCLQPAPAELCEGVAGALWGRANQFKAGDFMPPLKARKLDRCSQFAVATAGLAMADAGLVKGSIPPDRIGIALGCGFGGIANSAEFLTGYFQQGVAGLVPLLFPNTVANAPASNASIEYGIKGPNITFVQRFCSAESAILAACRFIEEGRADVMLAGGVDELTPLMMQGFAALGQLHRHARGFGEGAGILVLERADHAAARQATVKASIQQISTIGLLLAKDEKTGIARLLSESRSCHHLMVSGAEEVATRLVDAIQADSTWYPGRLVGRSLAMGGMALATLATLVQPGEDALLVSASPDGPYFSIKLTGGYPA